MYHSDLTVEGTFREKHATFNYDPEVNGGTLTIQGDDRVESIVNNNIVAVTDRRSGADTADNFQEILLLSSASEPSNPVDIEYTLDTIRATKLPQPFIAANSISPRIAAFSRPKAELQAHILYVIISTLSGTGGAQRYFDNVVKPAFSAVGIQEFAYYVHTTYSDKSISNFASTVILPRANEGTPQTILLLSGDGGIVDIVNAILSADRSEQYVKPAIGLIALGTGNAFANSTGLNRDSTKGLRHFFRGEPRSIPTFTATFSKGSVYLVDEGRRTEALATSREGVSTVFGAVVCSWALHASLVADSDTTELRRYGSQRFQMAAKELLMPSDGSEPHAYAGKIALFKKDTQGHQIEWTLDAKNHMYILATLVSNLEEKLTISPHSKPLDGQIRLLHLPPISSAEVMKVLGLAFQNGKHIEEPVVGYEVIEGLRIDFDEVDARWRRVCVDGKIVRVGEGGWLEMQNSSTMDVLDVIVDEGS